MSIWNRFFKFKFGHNEVKTDMDYCWNLIITIDCHVSFIFHRTKVYFCVTFIEQKTPEIQHISICHFIFVLIS